MDLSPQYLIEGLLAGCGYFDYSMRKVLADELGPERSKDLARRIWGLWAETQTKHYMSELKIEKPDVRTLGELARRWWGENWLCVFETIENTPQRYEGHIVFCPFQEIVKELGLAEKQSKQGGLFKREDVYLCSMEEVKRIIESTGLTNQVTGSMDKFICTGDDVCRIIFERKK